MRGLFALAAALLAVGCKPGVDLDVGRAYACTLGHAPDEQQCGPGWRCGLEGYCHDAQRAAPYLCTDDTLCAGGWRCGFEGRCVDPAPEALTMVGPRPTQGRLRAPVVMPASEVPAQVATDGVGSHYYFQRGVEVLRLTPLPAFSVVKVGVFDAGVELLAHWNGAYALQGSTLFRLDPSAPSRPVTAADAGQPHDFSNASLRGADQLGGLLAFTPSSTRFELSFVTGAQVTPYYAGPSGAALDLANVGAGAGACLFAASTEGLFYAPALLLSPWARLPLQASDGGALRPSQARLRTGPPYGSGVVGLAWGEGGAELEQAVLLDVGAPPFADDGGVCVPWAADAGEPPRSVVLGPCDPCRSPEEELVDFAAATQHLVSECHLEGRTSFYRVTAAPGGCSYLPLGTGSSLDLEVFTLPERVGNPGSWARLGSRGQLWGSDAERALIPLFADRAPQGLVSYLGRDGGALLVTFGPTYSAGYVPDTGFLALGPPPADPIVAQVPGTDILLTESGLIVVADRLAGFTSSLEALGSPSTAQLAPKRDGGTELVVSRGDALYSAPFVAPPADELMEPRLKVVPQPGVPLVSVAGFVGGHDAGAVLAAWALTQNGLFRVRAETESRWRATDVPVPDGELLEVWVDEGARGRLGFRDGTVLSLPSLLPLAGPLAAPGEVQAYARLCGQTFAAVRGYGVPGPDDGLFRLEPGAGGLGAWVRLDLTDPVAPPHVFGDLTGARLLAVGDELWLFTAYGSALSFSPCP